VPAFPRTKIQPPRTRAGALVVRPALQQRLVEAMQQRALVLVTATAGYGKTSALTQALTALPEGSAVAWIGCDRGDSPLQLFGCLVAALDPFDLPWRIAPEALFATALAGGEDAAARLRARRQMVAALIDALDACENVPHGVIVVDDLHRIDHPDVFHFIELLLERFTPRWTLVLASRQRPPIPLQRLRAQGDVAEFGPAELRFDQAQTRAMAAAAGLDVDTADSLHQRTQGWPAGLRLALNVLCGAPGATLAGTATLIDRQVFEFLATEVVDRQAPELRAFLVATSLLPELTPARCAALTGDERASEHLEAIERAGLFVTSLAGREGDAPTLRLHDLFRDALEHRLLRERAPELPALLERAARSEPDPTRRLAYWLRAQRWDEAARELHEQSYALLTADQGPVVEGALSRFPRELVSTLPDLQLVRTLLAWLHWRWQEMADAAQAAAEGFEHAQRPLNAIAARAYRVLALRGLGRSEPSQELAERVAREVDALLAERASERRAGKRWDGNDPGMLAAMLGRESVVWCAFDDARLDDVAAATDASIDLLDHSTGTAVIFQMIPLPDTPGLRGMRPVIERFVRLARSRLGPEDAHLASLVQALDGSVRLWAGDVAAALPLLHEAEAEVRWHGFPLRSSLHVYPFLCIAALLRGDGAAFALHAARLEQALRAALALPDIGHRAVGEFAALARLHFLAGRGEDALRLWREFADWAPRDERPLWHCQRRTRPAYLALAERRLAEAEQGFAQALAEHGGGLDIQGQASELRLRVAGLRLQLGRAPHEATVALAQLFERHTRDEDIAAVWLVGPEALQALAQAPWQGALGDDHLATLRRWADGAAALRGQATLVAPPPPTSSTGDGAAAPRAPGALADNALSEREREVLALLAAGQSNKLIAREFDLSPHTVKRHVANILDKLDLRSRGQAAAWFHQQAA
jgi:LuxR family transcriptional regulator, maltose regulon positive regulatory protein